jgi:membrane protein implicated in regulation of membrane protease activity
VDDWLIWLIVGVACLALETMTLSFVVSYFGIGALAASAAALLGLRAQRAPRRSATLATGEAS